jgi:hypothetical protein
VGVSVVGTYTERLVLAMMEKAEEGLKKKEDHNYKTENGMRFAFF